MSGESKGVQALLREKQPLALYVHCVWKYKTIFKEIVQSEAGSFITLKPLCPIRWLVRLVAIQAVVGQYEKVLLSLEEMAASGSSDTCTTARGLLERFQKGHTLLCLLLASEALKELECLNRSLQSKTGSVTGMLAAVDCVKKTLRVKRSDERFHQIYARACDMISEMGIETIQMPHIRRPPKRYTGNAAAFIPASTEEHYRIEFFKVLDAVDVQLTKRFDQSSFDTLNKLERVLVSGKVEEVVSLYPELNRSSPEVQLAMCKLQYPSSTITDAVKHSESYAARNKLDQVDIEEICQLFISANDTRRHVFGAFI
ncbi:hypothetical protein KUCAC02_006822 [Chaenocephalus aceratus]|uniref:Uncharacterized protein n=1 Tax=Chaenocephalus aceratus TaxID=36190 RepID=A0ACB9VT57_CHAAC|nr:hypothetical protein KUCAC02_006822 [Chaenocephalus aceratus]